MTGEEFKSAIKALGFSQAQFAKAHGMSYSAINEWASGRAKVPQIAAAYVRLLGRENPLSGWKQPETFDEWPDHAQVIIRLTAGEVRRIQGKKK